MNPKDYLKMTNEELQSKTISFLRFPLIVAVVLMHSRPNEVVINGVDLMQSESLSIYTTISYLFSNIIPKIAVPLFFFISGFLFFYKTSIFTSQAYKLKLKRRIKTLLIPYIFWNLVVIAFFFLSQTLMPEIMSGRTKLISNYTLSDWLWAFWNTNMINTPTDINTVAYPICYQFWFIRDLMVIVLLSPLIYFILKKLRLCFLLIIGIFWIFDYWFDIVGFSITALFFFSAGAYFSIYKKNFIEVILPLLPVTAILYVISVIIELYFREQSWCDYLGRINILIGIILAISLSAHFIKKRIWKVNSYISESSFFIYAYHGIFLSFTIKFLFKIIQPHTDGIMLIIYVFCPTTVIILGLFFYYTLRKYLPQITSFITGGR